MSENEKMEFLYWCRGEINLKVRDVSDYKYLYDAYDLTKKFTDTLDKNNHSDAYEIFRQLIKRLPLTPLEDREEDWVPTNDINMLRHKRYPSLYKDIPFGEKKAKFVDTRRVRCINSIDGESYNFPFGQAFINHHYPITFPYTPSEYPIRLYTVDFEIEEERFICLSTIIFPEGGAESIKMYFKMDKDGNTENINQEEFAAMYARYDELELEKENDQND